MDSKDHFRHHQFHKTAAAAHAGLAEECDGEGYTKMAEHHRTLSKAHSDLAEHHAAMHDANKAAEAADLAKGNQLVPTNVRTVVPTMPVPVLRHGMARLEKVNVPSQFEHLIAVDEDPLNE